ncbi:MAG: LytR C-terminal domain-containing protein [Candidatus Cloacimonetes bacterium]|jgi:hypothetical protein|nr:LytR C-terminal domain-containing protein [Candidatus Cloacimonadota bacterium]MCB5287651.1 LytR C-terminal domain-containing protein [Candidatus Cloacimonadota bacterium]MCK9184630.1 LytR C-terminal domain-containing protein [Candidatus Cloacimonadota bacterium]MCK9585043.1 LytR C-terminal domain-containing protein [Candidatus Cloacimonadota bacterium]MDY0229972.1 LytR C-terminal domain-containing protein [Candidatus Cloacimonadaceae bacterium]
MNEQLDLTTKPPAKKWSSKAWLIYAALALALVLILVFAVFRKGEDTIDDYAYGEDQLPAIKVIVLNGCGYDQLASDFAAALKHKNIDVISMGNTPRPIYDKSIIVMRKGDKHDLLRLQKMTGIQRWTSALNEYHSADFDIIVGRDFEQFTK